MLRFFALLLLISFTPLEVCAMDAKTKALLNVNPYTSPDDPSYIPHQLITNTRVNILSDLSYKLISPFKGAKDSALKMPLMIMLHGCGQSGQSFVESTQIFSEAQKNKFFILAPEQSRLRNFFGCWNFYKGQNSEGRQLGELGEILEMIKKVSKDFPVDTDRIYISGISAGAGMANNLAITHPHLFKGVALSAAPSYGYNPDGNTLDRMIFNTMGLSSDPTSEDPLMSPDKSYPFSKSELENLTKEKFGMSSEGETAKLKNVLIFHGQKDPMVDSNFLAVTETQYKNAFGSDDTETVHYKKNIKTQSKGSYRYHKTEYKKGNTVESYMINEMWHSWGGGDGRTFTAPNSLNQTSIMLKRFGLNTPPLELKDQSCIDLMQKLLHI